MQVLENEKQDIIDYANSLEEVCKKTCSCKDCPVNQAVIEGLDLFDSAGCRGTNHLIEITGDYREMTGNYAVRTSLTGLVIYAKAEVIPSPRKEPIKKGIIDSLKQLKTVLGGERIDQEDPEIEKLLKTKAEYPSSHHVSRGVSSLF